MLKAQSRAARITLCGLIQSAHQLHSRPFLRLKGVPVLVQGRAQASFLQRFSSTHCSRWLRERTNRLPTLRLGISPRLRARYMVDLETGNTAASLSGAKNSGSVLSCVVLLTSICVHPLCVKMYDRKRSRFAACLWIQSGVLFSWILVLIAPVFDTTPPGGRAAADGLCWHTSRESHPSEDLSELPPLLATVAGQEYHYQIADEGRAGIISHNAKQPATGCFMDGWAPLCTFLSHF